MTAIYWDAVTVVLHEPTETYPQGGVDFPNSTVSFRVPRNTAISTLSDRGAYTTDGIIEGFLYVPDLDESDPCAELSSRFLPQNVTRKATIPNFDQNPLVAVAPWLSDKPECASSYMRATLRDPSRGLIFFPTQRTAAISTPVWTTPDWGVNVSTWQGWVDETDYPIWGISSEIGSTLVQEMGKYSGNVSVSPFASSLSRVYPREDAVRLMARVTLNSTRDSSPVLGRLWVFAIMILAILCVVTGMTSLIMHLNQRRMRRDLRRRIAAGEVDLEVLGIKRQRVPQKLLDRMPQYVYTSKLGSISSPTTETTTPTPPPPRPFSQIQRSKLPKRDVPFSQTTCPICLDDFEHNETIVRELPCQHIFHPECVDEFLRTNSSLCPMCKKSALPAGYCPENITISMVRRERAMRRMQELGTDSPPLAAVLPHSIQRFLPDRLLRRPARPLQGAEQPHRRGDHISVLASPNHPPNTNTTISAAATSPAHPVAASGPDLELGPLPPSSATAHPPPLPAPETQPQTLEDLPPEIQALSAEERREWGRQRLAAQLPAATNAADEEARVEQQQLSRWRRGWKKMFPS